MIYVYWLAQKNAGGVQSCSLKASYFPNQTHLYQLISLLIRDSEMGVR